MAEDLRQQASKLYKEMNGQDNILTSDNQSTKRLVYITLGVGLALLLVLQTFGGFKKHQDPLIAAATPPPLIKEEPPPDPAIQKADIGTSEPARPPEPAPASRTEGQPAEKIVKKDTAPPPVKSAASKPKPALKRETPVAAPKEESKATLQKPAPDEKAEIAPAEKARRELAREMVVQQAPALAGMLGTPGDKGWEAEPQGKDVYLVTFTLIDGSTGTPTKYVWRVDLSEKSIAPLSYYARKLS